MVALRKLYKSLFCDEINVNILSKQEIIDEIVTIEDESTSIKFKQYLTETSFLDMILDLIFELLIEMIDEKLRFFTKMLYDYPHNKITSKSLRISEKEFSFNDTLRLLKLNINKVFHFNKNNHSKRCFQTQRDLIDNLLDIEKRRK